MRRAQFGTALWTLCLLVTGTSALWLTSALLHRSASTTVHVTLTPARPALPAVTPSEPGNLDGPDEPVEPIVFEEEPSPPVAPRSGDYALVFSLDGKTYASISIARHPPGERDEADGIEPALPAHAPFRYVGDDHHAQGAIANIEDDALPADIIAWRGRNVIIDNRCQATVADLSLVALLSGSLDYMEDRPRDMTRAEHVANHSTLVIAARLDGCMADHGIARMADLPLPMLGAPESGYDAKNLIESARARLLASPLARAAQKRYEENGGSGRWWRIDGDSIRAHIVRHPGTGDKLIFLHAVFDHGCGGANINLWGQYRASEDGDVSDVRVIDLGEIIELGHPVDLDGDGTFEFPAYTELGDHAVVSSDGSRLRTLDVPFYGCPC